MIAAVPREPQYAARVPTADAERCEEATGGSSAHEANARAADAASEAQGTNRDQQQQQAG